MEFGRGSKLIDFFRGVRSGGRPGQDDGVGAGRVGELAEIAERSLHRNDDTFAIEHGAKSVAHADGPLLKQLSRKEGVARGVLDFQLEYLAWIPRGVAAVDGIGSVEIFDGEMQGDIFADAEGILVQSDVCGDSLVARTPFAGDGGGIGNLDGQDVGTSEEEMRRVDRADELRDLQCVLALRAPSAIYAGADLKASLPIIKRVAESSRAARFEGERFRFVVTSVAVWKANADEERRAGVRDDGSRSAGRVGTATNGAGIPRVEGKRGDAHRKGLALEIGGFAGGDGEGRDVARRSNFASKGADFDNGTNFSQKRSRNNADGSVHPFGLHARFRAGIGGLPTECVARDLAGGKNKGSGGNAGERKMRGAVVAAPHAICAGFSLDHDGGRILWTIEDARTCGEVALEDDDGIGIGASILETEVEVEVGGVAV